MLEKFSSILVVVAKTKCFHNLPNNEILHHLIALENKCIRYFPELGDDERSLLRNTLKFVVEKVPKVANNINS